MCCHKCVIVLFASIFITLSGLAVPPAVIIDPIPSATIPAGKSLTIPITATALDDRPLTYTVTSSTNGIAVVMHTNNPFWQLAMVQVAPSDAPGAFQTPYRGGVVTVTNAGNMTFMLFPEYAPHTVNVFQGLTTAGFYNSNTIFHYANSNSFIIGGDQKTNGTGRLVFNYEDEVNPQVMFSGHGQLAVANSGKDTGGSQFFVTMVPRRDLDFGYSIFGQLIRGFDVLTNLSSTAVDDDNRPLADEIIQTATYVSDSADTVITLTGTNRNGVTGTITVIADNGIGGRATNVFTATTVTDTNGNSQPFIFPNTVTNLVGPANKTLTNFINAMEMDNHELFWFPEFLAEEDFQHATNSSFTLFTNKYKNLTYNITNIQGQFELFIKPVLNYTGTVSMIFDVSANSQWNLYQQAGLSLPAYDQEIYTFVVGDTAIKGQSQTVTALAGEPFSNALLATFTNGVPGSSSTNFTAAINWGDNSTNSGVLTANSAGFKGVLGSHTYQYSGTYPVYIQVQSRIGASATILSYVTVTNQSVPASNLFTVQTTGQGTVTPAYSNAALNVGEHYTLSASSTGTWVLVSWTDQNGFVLGTSPNLEFNMSQGLEITANFALAAIPTLTISSPTTGKTITNLYSALATATGSAANNAPITGVWYQLNSGNWQLASGTTNWSASFTPAYGVTNTFKAYAVNSVGITSTTNSVLVKYLAGDILTLSTNGRGSISPNLNGRLLPLGTNYILTAKTNVGFAFSGWTGSATTNNPALSFTMATNLNFTANFIETSKPTLTVTSPTNNKRMTNALAVVVGTTSDNWGVQGVWVQLNSNSWNLVSTANAYTNWTTTLTLLASTNTIKTYALNLGGLYSATNTLHVISSNTFQLQLVFTNAQPLKPTGLAFNLQVSKGLNGRIQYSSNLTNWNTLTNFIGTTSTNISFLDPAATNSSSRYYRAVVP